MSTILLAADPGVVAPAESAASGPDDRGRPGRIRQTLRWVRRAYRVTASATDWVFGAAALTLGLSVLAAVPVAQFLCFGYLLEAGGRVARTGRLRDGFVGVRKAS